MSDYRITSANFLTPGESGDPDAFMSDEDLASIQSLAGITPLVSTKSKLADFLQAGIDLRKEGKIEPVNIIREQKYNK